MGRPLTACALFAAFVLLLWQPGRSRALIASSAPGAEVVEDGCGAQVALGAPGGDIVLLTPTIAEYLFVTGSADRLLSGYAANGLVAQHTLLARRFPSLNGPRVVNSRVPQASSAEWLMTLAPAAVFAWPFQVDALRALGLPAVCVLQSPSYEDVRRNAKTVGAVTHTTVRAEALARRYPADLAAVRAATEGLAPVRALFVNVSAQGRLSILGRRSVDADSMSAAGVQDASPRAGGTTVVDPEQLLLLDPSTVVLASSGVDGDGPDADAFLHDPRWRVLRAVRDRRVYATPRGMSIYFSGVVETPLYARWLAETAHPTLPPALRRDMKARYREAFGGDVTESELDGILRLEQNRAACGYGRFRAAQDHASAAAEACAEEPGR